MVGRFVSVEVLLEAGEFGFEFSAFIGGSGGGDEGAGLIGRVGEGAVEPECDLPVSLSE